MNKTRLQGVFEEANKRYRNLFTKNLTPGFRVYDEVLIKEGGIEYRSWNPKKSKLAAAILKGASQIGIKEGDVVLYLGAASGTTVSHVSDIVEEKGFVFALDFAPRVLRDLVFVCEKRKNIAPILSNANKPESYIGNLCTVDTVYQDVAQRNQEEIFLKNCDLYLKKNGFGLLAVKARSVDVSKNPKKIFNEIRKKIEEKMVVVDYRELEPFQKDHCMFICKKK